MYAVIKTGGKQYRVSPGDVLVVEKLGGEPGAEVAFGDVLMVGQGDAVTVGAPLVAGASVKATLIETRKGEKVKIFKKIRRQGYRRTRGHRQLESVLRVTAVTSDGKTEAWDGTVDLTPLSVLNARARGLAGAVVAAEPPPAIEVEVVAEPQAPGKASRVRAKVVEHAEPVAEEVVTEAAPAEEAPQAEAAPKKAPRKKAAPKPPKDESES